MKLQSVQNFAARITTGTRKFDHITPALQVLNWWLEYRDGVLAFKILQNSLNPIDYWYFDRNNVSIVLILVIYVMLCYNSRF